MPKVLFSQKFIEQLEVLSPKIQTFAEKKIVLFQAEPKHTSLRTHRLHGPLKDYFSFSVNHQFRIVFEYGKSGIVHLLKIGGHEIYR